MNLKEPAGCAADTRYLRVYLYPFACLSMIHRFAEMCPVGCPDIKRRLLQSVLRSAAQLHSPMTNPPLRSLRPLTAALRCASSMGALVGPFARVRVGAWAPKIDLTPRLGVKGIRRGDKALSPIMPGCAPPSCCPAHDPGRVNSGGGGGTLQSVDGWTVNHGRPGPKVDFVWTTPAELRPFIVLY